MQHPDENIDNVWSSFIPPETAAYVDKMGSMKVMNRVNKAKEHYYKALKLRGIDEEMGMIRLIAAEEEIVVAVFKILESKKDLPDESIKYLKRYTNHQVKLSFTPILSEFINVLKPLIKVSISEDKVNLQIISDDERTLIPIPKGITLELSMSGFSDEEVIKKICENLSSRYTFTGSQDFKEVIKQHAQFRNRILYSDDHLIYNMSETLDETLKHFDSAIANLYCALALLLNEDVSKQISSIINLLIAVCRKATK